MICITLRYTNVTDLLLRRLFPKPKTGDDLRYKIHRHSWWHFKSLYGVSRNVQARGNFDSYLPMWMEYYSKTSAILGWRNRGGACVDLLQAPEGIPGQILRDCTCIIRWGHGIKVRTNAPVWSTQVPTCHCWCQSSLDLQPHEEWCWSQLIRACVDLPQASIFTIISIILVAHFSEC